MQCGSSLKFVVNKLMLFFSPENTAEDQSYQRSAVEHLVKKSHGKIHCPGLDPAAEGVGIIKKNRCKQAHNGAHDAADANRNSISNELGTVGRLHNGKGQLSGNLTHHEEFQNEGNGNHDGHFMKCQQKGLAADTSSMQGYIVNNHAIDHDRCHNGSKNNIFKLIFGHKKSSF